jgi:hypothetical protein
MKWLMIARLALGACKQDKKKDQATATGGAGADEWVALYGAYAIAMEKNAGDCDKAAAAVRDLNYQNAALLARARQEPARFAAIESDQKQKIGAELDRMAPILDTCRPVEAFMAALKEGPFRKPK